LNECPEVGEINNKESLLSGKKFNRGRLMPLELNKILFLAILKTELPECLIQLSGHSVEVNISYLLCGQKVNKNRRAGKKS